MYFFNFLVIWTFDFVVLLLTTALFRKPMMKNKITKMRARDYIRKDFILQAKILQWG